MRTFRIPMSISDDTFMHVEIASAKIIFCRRRCDFEVFYDLWLLYLQLI